MNRPATTQAYRYAEIERYVTQLIDSGTLKSGDKLPSLRKMSKNLRVSVPTVAKAYEELERRGVVESRERSGFFVSMEHRALPRPCLTSKPRPQLPPQGRSALEKAVMCDKTTDVESPFLVSCPDSSLMAGRCLGKVLSSVVRDHPWETISYEHPMGNEAFRRQVARLAMEAGTVCSPDEIIVTTGAMEAASIMLRTVTRPGDAVLVQAPSFLVYLHMLELLGLRPIEVSSCPQTGISVECVRQAVQDFDVRAALFVPNFHVDGSLTPDEAKAEITAILNERGIPLIEDDVFGDLYFGNRRPGLCRNHDTKGLVATCSSFSKTIAPGYRVGWLMPGRFLEKAKRTRNFSGVRASTPIQMAMAEFLRRGIHDDHLKRLRTAIMRDTAKMRQEICRHFPEGTEPACPAGGTSMWVRLPEKVNCDELYYRAREHGAAAMPGSLHTYGSRFDNYVRLFCKGVWDEKSERAIKTLGALVTDMSRPSTRAND